MKWTYFVIFSVLSFFWIQTAEASKADLIEGLCSHARKLQNRPWSRRKTKNALLDTKALDRKRKKSSKKILDHALISSRKVTESQEMISYEYLVKDNTYGMLSDEDHSVYERSGESVKIYYNLVIPYKGKILLQRTIEEKGRRAQLVNYDCNSKSLLSQLFSRKSRIPQGKEVQKPRKISMSLGTIPEVDSDEHYRKRFQKRPFENQPTAWGLMLRLGPSQH